MGRHGQGSRLGPSGHNPAPPARPTTDPGGGHGPRNGHGPAAPAGQRVRVLLAALLLPCAVASVLGALVLYPFHPGHQPATDTVTQRINAEIAAATTADCGAGQPSSDPAQRRCVALSLLMSDGPAAGRGLVSVVPVEPSSPRFTVGDHVVLSYAGGDPTSSDSYTVTDFRRGGSLWVLGLLFAGSVIVLGRWRGLAALAALGVSFLVLITFVLPAILDGRNPLAVAVAGSCLIMFAVLYLSHGLSARTSTAVLGTLVSLGLIGVLGTVFAAASR